MRRKLLNTAVLFSFAALMLFQLASGTARGANVQKTAQHYIKDFRSGADFRADDSVAAMVINRSTSRSHLTVLAKELATGTPHVRENIVKVLEKIGLELDSPGPNKFPVIRDAGVIRALVVQGFAKDDSAASAAAAVLRRKCMPGDLAAFNDVYTKSIKEGNGDFLYIAAKAKTFEASQYVEKMAESPLWQEFEEDVSIIRIAQAALGNEAVEDEFIQEVLDAAANAPPAPKNRFYNIGDAKDGAAAASHMPNLGYIGTKKSLRVACGFLRSPLKWYMTDNRERSVRYYALDAIRYNFPDERVLFEPLTLDEWVAAEKFCIEKLGATFDGPTPSLPRDFVYPRIR